MKRIGLVGFGGICNGAHIPGYEQCGDLAKICAVCDIDRKKLEQAKQKLGLPDECLFTDYQEMIDSGLIDAVDICTPNYLHCQIAEAAIAAGLDYSIEKPIGINLSEAAALYEKEINSSSKSFVCFSYRYMAPFRYMREVVKSGKIGKIRHIYMTYLKNSGLIEGRRFEWRFDKAQAGTGVLGDLAVHMIDAVRFLGEEFDGVFAQMGITVKERARLDSDEIAEVTTDDWCNINGMTKSGASVDMRITRVATTVPNFVEFDVFCENGRIVYKLGMDDFGRASAEKVLLACGTKGVLTEVDVPQEYSAVQSREFVKSISGEASEMTAGLDQGVICQAILEALEISSKEKRYVYLDEFDIVGEVSVKVTKS